MLRELQVSLSLTLALGMGCQWDPVAEGAGGTSVTHLVAQVTLPKESRAVGVWSLGSWAGRGARAVDPAGILQPVALCKCGR